MIWGRLTTIQATSARDLVKYVESCSTKGKAAMCFGKTDAKAAVGKEWDKLQKMPAWQMTKVRSKREVIQEAQQEGRTVHFATLMDVCHLKNSEAEQKFQKYNER